MLTPVCDACQLVLKLHHLQRLTIMYLSVGTVAVAAGCTGHVVLSTTCPDSTAQHLTHLQLGPALLQGRGGMAALQTAQACGQPGN